MTNELELQNAVKDLHTYILKVFKDPKNIFDEENSKKLSLLLHELSTSEYFYQSENLNLVVTSECLSQIEYLEKYTKKIILNEKLFSSPINVYLQNNVRYELMFLLLPYKYYNINYIRDNKDMRLFCLADFISNRAGDEIFTPFYYFLFDYDEDSIVNALAKTYVHEKIHIILHSQNKEIWRFIDEGIAQVFDSLIHGTNNFESLDIFSFSKKELISFVTSKRTSFENLFIRVQLIQNVSGIEELKEILRKIVDSRNILADISILKNSLNLNSNPPDSTLSQMFVNYILAKMFVLVLFVDFSVDLNELKFIDSFPCLLNWAEKRGIDLLTVGEMMFGHYVQASGLEEDKFIKKVEEYYSL